MKKRFLVGLATGLLVLAMFGIANAGTIFSDTFDTGASLLWGNESAKWESSSGVYYAISDGRAYSSLPFQLTDLTLELDINNIWDAGVFFHSSGSLSNGVSLIVGGEGGGGSGLYWHTWTNGNPSGILNHSGSVLSPGSDVHLRIEVVGDTYSAFLNGATTPTTTFTNSDFPIGEIALYSNEEFPQSFDNVNLYAVPIPSAVWLLGSGLIGLVAARRKNRS